MRRRLSAPGNTFCLIPCQGLAIPLLTCLLISACSLPPKPRLMQQPKIFESPQPQKTKPAKPKQRQQISSRPSATAQKITTPPLPRVETISKLVTEKNTDEKLLSALSVFLNAPYELGGATPEGVDCSGLVKSVFAEAYGFNLPHNAASQFRLGAETLESQLRLGDLVFFEKQSRRGRYVSHVGIYLSNRRFAHASTKAGVTVSGLDEAYWRRRFAGARRLIDRP